MTVLQVVAVLTFFMSLKGKDRTEGLAAQHSARVVPESTWPELTASMEKMHPAMGSIGPTGNSDVDFVKSMLPHHQAAIDMAKTQLMNGNDVKIRRLAQEIITDEQLEIELMQLWLEEHSNEH
jgi:uncharacterized protein (DUF305 family)